MSINVRISKPGGLFPSRTLIRQALSGFTKRVVTFTLTGKTLTAEQALSTEITATGDHLHMKIPASGMTLELSERPDPR